MNNLVSWKQYLGININEIVKSLSEDNIYMICEMLKDIKEFNGVMHMFEDENIYCGDGETFIFQIEQYLYICIGVKEVRIYPETPQYRFCIRIRMDGKDRFVDESYMNNPSYTDIFNYIIDNYNKYYTLIKLHNAGLYDSRILSNGDIICK